MIRRVIGAVLTALLALPLFGCWDRIEVNDLAIVSMMAIDKAEDGRMKLWLHVVVPAHAGGAPGILGGGGVGGTGQAPFITMSAEGDSVLEASRAIQTQLPRRIFWAHMRVIVIGERLAREGLQQVTDFLTRHREVRLTNYVLVANGSVEEIMATPVDLEKLPVEYLREISHFHIGVAVMLSDLEKMASAPGADPILGVAELVPPPAGAPPLQKPGLKLGGTALFRGDKLATFMDESTTRGLLWLRGEIRPGVATIELPGMPGRISVEWVGSDVKRTAELQGGRPVVHIKAESEADVMEESTNLDLSDPDVVARVDRQVDVAIRQRMEKALDQLREAGTDSAGLGEVIHQQMPAVWRQIEKRWKSGEFQRLKVVIEADVRIRRTGLSGKPRGAQANQTVR